MIVKNTVVRNNQVTLELESGLDISFVYDTDIQVPPPNESELFLLDKYGLPVYRDTRPRKDNYITIYDSLGNGLASFEPDNLWELLEVAYTWVNGSDTEIGDTKPLSWFNNAYVLVDLDHDIDHIKENYVDWFAVGKSHLIHDEAMSYCDDYDIMTEEVKSMYIDHNGGFVLPGNAEHKEVWLFRGSVPYLDKYAERVA
jgi:hypothetical protein